MSIEVRIPKEITEYKEKILFGLSIRQLVCFIIAIVTGVGTYYIVGKYFGTDFAGYVVILETMPVFAIGFIRKNGFTFEKYVALMFKFLFGKNKREYKTELLIDKIQKNEEETRESKGLIRRDKNAKSIKKIKKTDRNISEYNGFQITKESRKRKSKEAKSEIKTARQEYRRTKQTLQKAAKKTSRT